MSSSFVKRHRRKLDIHNSKSLITHSEKNTTEQASQLVINSSIKIGSHVCRSNFVVASCRYDVLLGMTWDKPTRPKVDYKNRDVKVEGSSLPLLNDVDRKGDRITISNLSIKKFKSLLRKKATKQDFEVYQVVPVLRKRKTRTQINNVEISEVQRLVAESPQNTKLKHLLERYRTVFKDELPPGLPPERDIDREVETKDGETPPRRGLYQLSPLELEATRECITDLLKKRKIRPSRSPYGAPLFFVKHKRGMLRGVVDYRGLNRITKRNSTPIPRTDEMFDRLSNAKFFSKLDIKSGILAFTR